MEPKVVTAPKMHCETPDPEDIELMLLLEAIYQRYGYDFRGYSRASLQRRVEQNRLVQGLPSISALQHAILHDTTAFGSLLAALTINVTEMFRDPGFYASFRQRVVPFLQTYPFIKVWHAGCATGEEVYSTAILLKEEGLYDRCQIYATDIDKQALDQARRGIFPSSQLRRYQDNYARSGGKGDLSAYCMERYDHVIMDPDLKRNIVFADHDLVTDQVFGEMQVVLCRNVLIYFTKPLQNRVLDLFRDSLDLGGILCLGSKESLRFSSCADRFEALDLDHRIYRKLN